MDSETSIFSAIDYLALLLMLAISAAIGLYHGVCGSRQQTTEEYFLGNREMGPIPVALSILASYMSAITYLGTPAEAYVVGPEFWMISLNCIIVGVVITRTFIPIFYRLQLTSIYEYFDLRFNKAVRMSVVAFSTSFGLLYLGIVIYAPSLALNAVAGISLPLSILTMGLVCTLYTSVGGIKGVIWTDVFQFTVMMLGFFIMIIVGCWNVGGVGKVWQLAAEGNRTTLLDFRIDPTIRHTFWTLVVGGTFQVVFNCACNQLIAQRFLSCNSEKNANRAAWLGVGLIGLTQIIAVVTGIVMYAFYADCDPLKSQRIQKKDQLIPLFIVDLVGSVPGMAGVLISCAFSASLSSVSSGMNALAAIVAEDLIKPHFSDIEDKKLTVITKLFAAGCGLLGIVLAFIASVMGDLLNKTLILMGIVSGPVLGVFTLGIFFPWSTSKGVLSGLVVGSLCGIGYAVGREINPTPYIDPPVSIEGCPVDFTTITPILSSLYNVNTTELISPTESTLISGETLDYSFYSLSYLYISFMAWSICIIVGLAVSFLTGANDPLSVDPELLSPIWESFCCCLPDTLKRKTVLIREQNLSQSALYVRRTSPKDQPDNKFKFAEEENVKTDV